MTALRTSPRSLRGSTRRASESSRCPPPLSLVPASNEVGGEVRKTPTVSTANTLKCKKDPLNRLFLRVRTRSVSPAAVDKAVSARDSYEEYRPHESPANSNTQDRAGDADGNLLALLGESSSSDRSLDLQPGAHKIVLNVAVVEEWVLHAKNLKLGRPTAAPIIRRRVAGVRHFGE